MNAQLSTFWQNTLSVGQPFLPYVGLVLLIVLALVALALILYLLYKLIRRLPISFRHIGWRLMTGLRRLGRWLNSRRTPVASIVWANFCDGTRTHIALQESFPGAKKSLPWQRITPVRPEGPLFLFFGPEGSARTLLSDRLAPDQKSALSRMGPKALPAADVTWWHLEGGWLLEVSPQFANNSKTLAFASLLDTLAAMCPACPVDAVLVVLPAEPIGAGEQAGHLPGMLGDAVARMTERFGDALPTHVLVSGGESLNGFHDLLVLRQNFEQQECCLGVPALQIEQASPDQVVDLLRASIQQQIVFTMAGQPDPCSNFQTRGVLALPGEIERIRPTIATFVAHLYAATHTPALRSICVTGTAHPHSLNAENLPTLVFAQQQLREQVLAKGPERPMSLSYKDRLAEQARKDAVVSFGVLATALIVLIWGVFTWHSIGRNAEEIDRALASVAPEIRRANPQLSASFIGVDIGSLGNLLRATQGISDGSFAYVLVPVSWGNDLRNNVLSLIGSVIERILLRPRTENLTAAFPRFEGDALADDKSVAAQRIEELPAYASLEAFLNAHEAFSASMESGERLAKSISYRDFLQFLGYKPEQIKLPGIDWDKSMPGAASAQFRSNAHKSSELDAAIRKTVEILWERVLHEAFDLHPVVKSSEQIVDGMRALAGVSAFGAIEAQQLADHVRRVRQETDLLSTRRLLGSKTDTLAFFAKAQLRLSASSIVSTAQVVELIVAAEKRYERTRARLVETELEGIGPLYAIDTRDNSVTLNQDFKRFASAYAIYMAQPFLRQPDPLQKIDLAPGQYLEWPTGRLDQMRQMAQNYRDYTAGSGQSFDPRIRANLLRLAQQNQGRLVEAAFVNSAHVRYDSGAGAGSVKEVRERGIASGLAARAANLAAVGKFFRQISQDGTTGDFGGATELVVRETLRLLEQVELSLFFDDPYQPVVTGIGHWVSNGSAGKSLASDYSNPAERFAVLREYVRVQYAGLVAPLLDNLTNIGHREGSDEIVARWKRLRDVIDSYDKGAAGNSLFELERYVLALSKLRDADACNAFIDERPLPIQRSDYFSQKLTQLDHVLVLNCDQRYTERRHRQYESFAAWFNNTAAGRMPFASHHGTTGRSPLSAEQFQRVIVRYNEFRQQMERGGRETNAWPDEIAQYILRMDQIARQFSVKQNSGMANQGNTGTPKAVSAVDVSRPEIPVHARITFRAARSDEVGADQIIGWSLSSAQRSYTPRANALFEWRVGEPIEIRLRWAAESLVSPLPATAKSADFAVNERVAIFRYGGDWALMDLLDHHQVKGSGGLLQFEIPTLGPAGRSVAKIYIALSSPEENAAWLPDFPVEAPLLRNGASERP